MSSESAAIRAKIVKERGPDKVLSGSDSPNTTYLPSGVFLLDLATLGGFHDGRATLLYGVESSGKSTLGYMGLISAQRKYPGSKQVLLDFEHMFEPRWFSTLGGDPSLIELIQPEFGEEGIDMAMAYMDANDVSAVMVDSIATIIPKNAAERSVEDYGRGERARLAGLMCEKILTSWSRERPRGHKCSVILVNQYRDDMGKMMGDTRKLPGGWQANYLAKTRIQMKCRKKEKEDGSGGGLKMPDHNLHTFTLTKDKGSSIQTGEFKINLNPDHPRGLPVGAVDDLDTVGAYAKRMNIIHGGGSSWKLEGVEVMIDPERPSGTKVYDPLGTAEEHGMSPEKWAEALDTWERKGRVFRVLSDIQDYLYARPTELLRVKQQIIADIRVSVGMPALPPDNYLLDWCNAAE